MSIVPGMDTEDLLGAIGHRIGQGAEPPLRLSTSLILCRDAGMDFEAAWTAALPAAAADVQSYLEKEQWLKALRGTKDTWDRAWHLEDDPLRHFDLELLLEHA